ncbi:MAG: hypothetical protein ACD_3C00008G0002 [uncultured bacterium (gcode 4)]|uniref:Uncharacterized protein n=1 Tax=uncultured bacterium (gcode 4) TaxID=1234023 RepID=K2GZ87_9BACT|nr:MAG: hypothetical protein ACD_3C00008G0002 [uncultured bacterium (gcode 4)]
MFDKSVNLVESLALDDWLENDKNAIVASIAKMTITTISSTSVKAFLHLLLVCLGWYIKYEVKT